MTSNIATVSAPPRRSAWLPSIGLSLWLIFVLALTLSQWRLVMINADGDPCLHWRIGHWMIEHRAVIRIDVFSHTRMNVPLISKEWLSELLFAAAGDAFGWNGVVLLSAVLIATYLWLLHRLLIAEGTDLILATVLTLLATLPCSVHWLARPHLFTHLFAVVFTWQLRLFDRGKLPTRSLLVRLPPLMVLWVNLHGAFFIGLVIIATFLLGNTVALLTCQRDVKPKVKNTLGGLGLLAVACVLATLVNPSGWKLPAHVVEFLRDPMLARYANEFRSPNFHTGGVHGFVIELALVALTLVLLRPSFGATDVVVMGTWGLLALLAARNVPIFALVITPILAEYWQTVLTKAAASGRLESYRRFSAKLAARDRSADGRAAAAVAIVALLAIIAKPGVLGGNPIIETDLLTNRFPVAAVHFLHENPKLVSGEMFNDYGWGGYLALVMPEHKVFVDGRNDFYGATLIQEFRDVSEVHTNWETVLRKYGVGWTILPRIHPLSELLAERMDWRLAYEDDVAAIYARRPE